jgi:FSR family fosmidomycin resistance protein-like MFS transporter
MKTPLRENRRRLFPLGAIGGLAAILLAIEFLDELVGSVYNTAWPLIRTDLGLSYAQIGLLVGLPFMLGNILEPVLGLLGDIGHRKKIILGGGFFFILALLLTSVSTVYLTLLCAAILFSPSSGAFVSLSQATLMDMDPERREQSMAKWTLAGSVGVVAGPLLLSAALLLGGSWRSTFILLAAAAFLLWLAVLPQRFGKTPSHEQPQNLKQAMAGLLSAFRHREVLRWLSLLALSDLMLDVLLGFLALYFTDIATVTPAVAAVAVAVWTGAGLISDVLIIPLLRRVNGAHYLRVSAIIMIGVYAGFLLVPWLGVKFILLACMGILNAGWYAIPQARLYSALPGKSGTAMAVSSAFGVATGLIPVALGLVAQTVGLNLAMWILLLGPVGLALWLPRESQTSATPPPLVGGGTAGK